MNAGAALGLLTVMAGWLALIRPMTNSATAELSPDISQVTAAEPSSAVTDHQSAS